jgi:hypothetical protein
MDKKEIKERNIRQFKRGDYIVRVIPSETGDRSYIGEKMQFLGVANGVIHLQAFDSILKGRKKLELDWWSDGWDYYKEVYDIEDSDNFLYTFQNIVTNALINEDYELLAKLKSILTSKKQKNENKN